MKRTVAILAVALTLLGTMPDALAAWPVCPVYGCLKTRNHTHNGKTYSAHHARDGHSYHRCGLDGCTVASAHSHGGGYGHRSGHGKGGHH